MVTPALSLKWNNQDGGPQPGPSPASIDCATLKCYRPAVSRKRVRLKHTNYTQFTYTHPASTQSFHAHPSPSASWDDPGQQAGNSEAHIQHSVSPRTCFAHFCRLTHSFPNLILEHTYFLLWLLGQVSSPTCSSLTCHHEHSWTETK